MIQSTTNVVGQTGGGIILLNVGSGANVNNASQLGKNGIVNTCFK